jgi:protein arginine kinase activator
VSLHPVCELCRKRPATTHLTELEPEGGERRELHLCPACIQSIGVQLESGPPAIAEIVAKGANEPQAEGEDGEPEAAASSEKAEAEEDEACPVCGLQFSDYANNNLFGCANCFLAFGDRVEQLLKRYHGATRHIGRAPQKAATVAAVVPQRRGSERRKLETALKEAVAKERYEEAAALRDQLRKLEQARAEKAERGEKADAEKDEPQAPEAEAEGEPS